VEKSGEQGIRKLGDRPAMHSMPYGKYAKSAKFFRQDNPPLRKASAVAKAMADKTADLRRMDRIISWLCVLGLAVLKMQASATDQPSPAGQAHGLKCSAPY